ncbi:thioesterase [Actinomadura sp. KC216]|uniref:thioesterase family protein n=1 Tax=Actinomadura sp. KC216 TaxID=2530370 RepID=UPI00104A1B16|nr:thioesterase family protein [Actinomadura sp. KC216]TDB87995.1 thioesterase [Actinomadura sp. KC216]
MDDTLRPGLEHQFAFRVTDDKTVPALYPEAPEFAVMPPVFATGFLVGLLELACVRAVRPYLDWPREQTVGTFVEVTHQAATAPGMTVTARVRLTEVNGGRLRFEVMATDGVDVISIGNHERAVVDTARFTEQVNNKALLAGP